MIDYFPRQPPEKDTGNREYKRLLYLKNRKNFPQKATQMLYRIYEGNGDALYLLGIEDNGEIGNVSKKGIDAGAVKTLIYADFTSESFVLPSVASRVTSYTPGVL